MQIEPEALDSPVREQAVNGAAFGLRLEIDPSIDIPGIAELDVHGSSGPDAATVPAGAKIWLRMETDPTIGIVDSAGNHVVGCTGTCPTLAVGKHARGYRFALEEVDVADAADLDSSAGFTGAIWVDLDALPTGNIACFWTKPFDNTKGYDTFTLCVDPTGTTIFDNYGRAVATCPGLNSGRSCCQIS